MKDFNYTEYTQKDVNRILQHETQRDSKSTHNRFRQFSHCITILIVVSVIGLILNSLFFPPNDRWIVTYDNGSTKIIKGETAVSALEKDIGHDIPLMVDIHEYKSEFHPGPMWYEYPKGVKLVEKTDYLSPKEKIQLENCDDKMYGIGSFIGILIGIKLICNKISKKIKIS